MSAYPDATGSDMLMMSISVDDPGADFRPCIELYDPLDTTTPIMVSFAFGLRTGAGK
jgi:hypothetical protein